ncbi:hypothetical protein GBAR_LOCUS19042 [Geodia barretti]|nr:hypothetical protein GBAR_LOCUS19042 [Geodia barretti]
MNMFIAVVLSLLHMTWRCEGNVELYLKEGKNPAACGGSITFTCKANNTNAVSIVKNGILCQTFERSGSTGPNNCSHDLSIELVSAVANPSNPFITIFEIDGQHYFEDEKEEVTVECKDAMGTAKILTLQVNSGSCHPLPECTYNCSNCPRSCYDGFSIQVPQPCHGFEDNVVVGLNYNGMLIQNSDFCFDFCFDFCKDNLISGNLSIALANKCGETLVTSPCIAVELLTSDAISTVIIMSTALVTLTIMLIIFIIIG